MDSKPDINEIKVEIPDEFCLDVRVKVENEIGWPAQMVLARNELIYEEFENNNSLSNWPSNNFKENYQDDITENYQQNINYEEFKQDFQTYMPNNDVTSESSIQVPHDKYQDRIIYEELKEESSQTCMLCGKCFSNSYSLLQHNLTHLKVPLIKRKVYMCEHCPKYYSNKTNLKNHILINHVRKYNPRIPITEQRHECLICKKTFSYKRWHEHMTGVHSETKIKCKECNLLFKCKAYLRRHYKYIHEEVKRKIYTQKTKCPKCPAIILKCALLAHIRNCHTNETQTCHLCNSKLKCKSYLRTHMKRVHYNDGILHNCEICGKEFKSERYVKVHIKNSHNKKKSFKNS
ncbi:zinc finger and SCAN domain-containing protein 26-like isoform X2 [Maniola hyperantus]|uniref:zinc finger and SCAN domain-containing protein 26-like isoform X2 n=1 Tax=Aphantopus hyperantus TaxID=2795564 RepID=UPI00374A87C2